MVERLLNDCFTIVTRFLTIVERLLKDF